MPGRREASLVLWSSEESGNLATNPEDTYRDNSFFGPRLPETVWGPSKPACFDPLSSGSDRGHTGQLQVTTRGSLCDSISCDSNCYAV